MMFLRNVYTAESRQGWLQASLWKTTTVTYVRHWEVDNSQIVTKVQKVLDYVTFGERNIRRNRTGGVMNKYENYREDSILRMMKVCISNGVLATAEQVADAWERYSDSMCAGWMLLPDNDESLFSIMEDYFTFSSQTGE